MKSLSTFTRWLRARGLSENSIATYSEAVIDHRKQYQTLSEKNVLQWKEGLAGRYKPSSMAARIKGMNAFLDFSGADIHLSGIKLPRIHHLENVISMADYHRLIRKMSESEDLLTRKWMLLWKTIAMTGMRISEVIQVAQDKNVLPCPTGVNLILKEIIEDEQ